MSATVASANRKLRGLHVAGAIAWGYRAALHLPMSDWGSDSVIGRCRLDVRFARKRIRLGDLWVHALDYRRTDVVRPAGRDRKRLARDDRVPRRSFLLTASSWRAACGVAAL